MEESGSMSAVVIGSSVHNERIERLWRDVHRCVSVLFYDLFYSLEREGKLNPLNDIDLYLYFCHALIQHLNHSLNLGTIIPFQRSTI